MLDGFAACNWIHPKLHDGIAVLARSGYRHYDALSHFADDIKKVILVIEISKAGSDRIHHGNVVAILGSAIIPENESTRLVSRIANRWGVPLTAEKQGVDIGADTAAAAVTAGTTGATG